MTGDRADFKRPELFLLVVASLCSVLLVGGCTSIRQMVGLDRVGPDEFAVESRAPLTIPPDFELRPPQAADASQQGGDQGLSNKLLGYGGDQGGAGVEKRETTTLKGVY